MMPTERTFTVEGPHLGTGDICKTILDALPEWFGIPEANEHYRVTTNDLPTWFVYDRGRAVGFVTVKRHNAYVAEVWALGVLKPYHRQGMGRALMFRAEEAMRDEGIEYMQVKTLGPSHPDESYARTRVFYAALGYRPLEEFTTIWDEANPCLIMIRRL